MADVDLYFSPTPNGWKATIFFHEAGVPYNLKVVNLNKGDQFQPDFLRISPNNRMPAIVDHNPPQHEEKGPLSIFESGALLVYLADKYQRFLPPPSRPKARSRVLQWLFWQVGGLGPMAGQLSHFHNYAPHVAPEADHTYALQRYQREFDRLLSVMDRQLQTTRYLGGDEISIADFASFPWVMTYKHFKIDIDQHKAVRRWYDELKTRPGLRAGMNVGRKAAKKTLGKGKLMSDKEKTLMFKQTGRSRL